MNTSPNLRVRALSSSIQHLERAGPEDLGTRSLQAVRIRGNAWAGETALEDAEVGLVDCRRRRRSLEVQAGAGRAGPLCPTGRRRIVLIHVAILIDVGPDRPDRNSHASSPKLARSSIGAKAESRSWLRATT